MKLNLCILTTISICCFIAISCCNQPASESNANEKTELPDATPEHIAAGEDVYICPCGGCPEVQKKAGGECPKCGMELVLAEKEPDKEAEDRESTDADSSATNSENL